MLHSLFISILGKSVDLHNINSVKAIIVAGFIVIKGRTAFDNTTPVTK